ncbi:MAG: RecX family transcriptional regulator [Christensenella sp.]
MGKITDIKEGRRNKERVNVYIDDEFAFAAYIDTALSNRLKIGEELDDEEIAHIKGEDSERYAIAYAMKLLSYRMRTERELRDKMKSKELPEVCIDAAIARLTEIGYIDDNEFANAYSQELLRKYGKRLVVQKLMQKGVPRELAQETVHSIGCEDDVINSYVERFVQKYRDEEPYKAKQKTVRALMSKGFDYDDIKSALLRYDEE